MERDGISVEFKMNGSTDEVQGIKFTKNGRTFSGSKVDKQFSYSKINYALTQNERAEQQQQQMQQSHQPEQRPLMTEELLSSSFGLFDLPADGGDDPEETAFRKRMQRKKVKGRKF